MSDHVLTFDPAFRLDLEQQRNRARDLHRASRAGDPAARDRFRRHHPAFRSEADVAQPMKLADAQLVIARETGLPSWPKLKAHILSLRALRDHIEHSTAAVDGAQATLHIRCGSDIKSRLREAGLTGDFLEYSDPLCQGPVIDDPLWLDRRADFLARAYGTGVNRDRAEIAAGLTETEAALHAAPSRYERIVLWFEHDSHDQLILARCLACFAAVPPRVLEMVTLDHFPGAMRFIGLGQLPPEALRLLWSARRPVTPEQAQEGGAVWAMLRRDDPSALGARSEKPIPGLPYLAPALRRHCQELPWTRDGLSLTQRLVLDLLAERPRRIGEVFRDLMREREPLPWLGDLMLHAILEEMKQVRDPVFTGETDPGETRWFRERLTITSLGRAVLAGEVDWLSLAPPERWLGGVCIRADGPCWRWDEATGTTTGRR